MPLKTFLLNKLSDRKCRLNGIWPSDRLPGKEHLCRFFSNRLMYSPEDLPPKIDLRNYMTPVEDQSSIGSCSANALAGAYEYLVRRHHGENTDVSRLLIYYNGRVQESQSETVTDSGCSMTSAIEALEEFGTCFESIWPYDVSRVNTRPAHEAYRAARSHKISEALQVNIDLHEMKSCLAQGFPFVFGLRLFASFDKAARTGAVPMPSSNDQSRQSHGSHALVAVGYSDQSQSFIVRNSWGQDWGDGGYCYIPYDYMTDPNFCFDAWTIRKVPNDDFGQDHWISDDTTDYQNVYDNDNDDDENYNRAIEHVEEGDFQINSTASAFPNEPWNRDNDFAYNDRVDYGQQWNRDTNVYDNDGRDYGNQQSNRNDNFGYNENANCGQQWNQDNNVSYDNSGDYGQQWGREDQSTPHHKHSHGHHHHHHKH